MIYIHKGIRSGVYEEHCHAFVKFVIIDGHFNKQIMDLKGFIRFIEKNLIKSIHSPCLLAKNPF